MPRSLDLREKISALRAFLASENRMPGYNEMTELFGYKSKTSVFKLLERLVGAGYLIKNSDGKAAPTGKLTGHVQLLGTVQAGFPSPAEEELLDTISLDEYLIERPEATFLLRVTGDSMIDAGIQPNDMVLIEKGATPRDNDIVIAQVDGEWTMKYFRRDASGVRLEPANANYPTICPRHSLEIGGIVRCVIRKY